MEGRYNLRKKELLNSPDRYGRLLNREEQISQLFRRRDGKRRGILKKIANIEECMGNQESRTKINFLLSDIQSSFTVAVEAHESVMVELDEEDDQYSDEFIEDLGLAVSNCAANVASHLDLRNSESLSIRESEREAKIWAWRESIRHYSECTLTSSS